MPPPDGPTSDVTPAIAHPARLHPRPRLKGSRRPPAPGGARRVLWLGAALALVLVTMGEARRPEHYGWLLALEEKPRLAAADPAMPGQPPPPPASGPEAPAGLAPEPDAPAGEVPGQTAPGPIRGPRDLLERFGVDQSRFERLLDGRPLHTDEEETALKVLFRLKDFKLEDVERWAHKRLDLAALAKDPKPMRGEVFALAGRVTAMQVCRPVPEAAERYEMPHYYRCDLVLDDSEQPAIVYADTVPRAWLASSPANQRCGAYGLFLKLGGEDPNRPAPIFAARRVAWYAPGMPGELGMDAGLFDLVVDKQTLLPEERETFYHLMAAVQRAKPGSILREAEAKARAKGASSDSVAPLFKQPAQERGRLVTVSGTARKVIDVKVPDPDIQARFGIEHYYEISVFTEDSQGNPLIFCAPKLPEGMPLGEGPDYREEVRMAGFFLKTWAYRVPPPPDAPPEKRNDMTVWKKQAPLLIGPEPVWYRWVEPESNHSAAIVAGALFVLAAAGIWLAMWRAGRGDKRFRTQVFPGPGGQPAADLGDLAPPAGGDPDFSGLEPPGDGRPPA